MARAYPDMMAMLFDQLALLGPEHERESIEWRLGESVVVVTISGRSIDLLGHRQEIMGLDPAFFK